MADAPANDAPYRLIVEPPTHWLFTGLDRNGDRVRLDYPDHQADMLYVQHHALAGTLDRKVEKADYIEARSQAGAL